MPPEPAAEPPRPADSERLRLELDLLEGDLGAEVNSAEAGGPDRTPEADAPKPPLDGGVL